MLKAIDLTKSFGARTLFEGVSFTMTPGERLGLVGRNGTGKSTLFKIILGQESADDGKIITSKGYKTGHLSQHLSFEHDTVLAEACADLPEQEGGWYETYRAEEALMGLGFAVDDFERHPSEFSGGFQVRLQLAKVLVSGPNLLLLDEPTNYLDIVSMRWLERYLRTWDGELILITHDRTFMDAVTTHTMIIHRGKIRRIQGVTSKLYEMLEKEEEIHEKTRLNEQKSRKHDEKFIERFRYKASKAKAVQSRIKALEKRDQMDRLEQISDLEFSFRAAPFNTHTMLQCEGLRFGYDDGPTLIDGLDFTIHPGDRIAVIGKNGKGKSTLLNLVAGELSPKAGTFKTHSAVTVAHFGQTNIDRLTVGNTVEEEIQSALPVTERGSARGICGLMMFSGDDALKKVDVLSGGERARVLLGKLLVSPANMLLLDEPTNHLDMQSIDSLIEAVGEFPGASVVVTHDERVLHALATKLVVFDRGGIRIFDGTYEDFLERVGWSDEDEAGSGKKAAKPNRKEARKLKQEIVAERSKALKPLQTRIDKLESEIVRLEGEVEIVNKALAEAAEAQDVPKITELSKDVSTKQQRIEECFAELEDVTGQHDEQAKGFDARIAELED